MKKILAPFLIFSIIFVQSFSYPAFGNPDYSNPFFSSSGKSIEEAEEIALSNLKDAASEEKNSRVERIFANPNTQLKDHLWDGSTLHAIYGTENPNVLLAMSGETIQILERIDDETFLIDGEVVTVKTFSDYDENNNLSKESTSLHSGWYEIPDPNVSWTYDVYVVDNIYLSTAIADFTVSTLAGILGFKLTGNPAVAVGLFGIAYGAITFVRDITDEDPSIVRIRRHIYKDTSSNGFLYRKTHDYGDVKYGGTYHSVSNQPDVHFYGRTIGGP